MSDFRVVSYNVRYFGHGTRGLASTESTMRRIASAVASLSPLADLVCLQEVETTSLRSNIAHPRSRDNPHETQLERFADRVARALELLGRKDSYQAHYFPAHVYRVAPGKHIYTTGLAVLAHRDFTIESHNSSAPQAITHHRVNAVRSLKQSRICAHVRFTHRSGESIDVFNTHLSLPSAFAPDFWKHEARMGWGRNQIEEVRNLVKFVDRERASDRYLVVGDFNALPGSPAHRVMLDSGVRDAFADAHRFTVEESRSWPTAGFMHLRMHLDHVFSGPGLSWLDFDDSHAFGDRTSIFHGLSDHVPLVGRCRVSSK
jgi:endonuclease/exonuclease/phosphatase family metal-dependent hydrolase